MSKKSKTIRTQITDLPANAAGLSEEELRTVFGGAHARGTKAPTNTNNGGCHDSDSEFDYSTY